MKRTTVLLSLGFAVLAAGSAQAGDWNNGAGVLVKDSGGMAGVPVPAPAPVAESFHWYVRADLGYAFKSSGGVTTTTSMGSTFKADYDNGEGPFHGGIGVGRYMTPTFRWDLTGEYRGFQKVQGGLTHSTATTYTPGRDVQLTRYDPRTNSYVVYYSGPSVQINTFAVERNEEVRVANHTILMNFYHDFNRSGGFNPYIGAGLGAAVREARVNYSQRATCIYTHNNLNVPDADQPCLQPDTAKSGSPSSANFGFAAALMAGVSYEVKPGIVLDTGYRAVWQGGNTTAKSLGDAITADSRLDHEFRTGVRWNIW